MARASTASQQAQEQAEEQGIPRPWGRLERILARVVREADHLSLYRTTHRIGRSDVESDIVFKQQYLSRQHCSVTLKNADPATGDATVVIQKHSKSGYLFVNKKPLAFHEEVQLRPGSIVHFTQPDTDTAIPHAYRFQILPEGLTPKNQKLRDELSAMEAKARPASRKRTRSQALASESQGSAQDSDEMPVAARTRSRPEKKLQRRTSTEPEPEQETQSENVNTSNLSMTLRNKTPSPLKATPSKPSPKAAGKKRRRVDASQLQEEEDDDAPATLQNLPAKQLKLAHENAIQKQQISSLQRELQQLRQQFESDRRAHEQVLLSREDLAVRHQTEKDAHRALKEGAAKREVENGELKAERDRLNAEKDQLTTEKRQLAMEKDQLKTEKDEIKAEKDRLEATMDAQTNRLNVLLAAHRELEQEYANEKAQRNAERVAHADEVLDLKRKIELRDKEIGYYSSAGQSDRSVLAQRLHEAEQVKRKYERRQRDLDLFVQEWGRQSREQTQSSESSEESPSVLAARRISQESSAGNEHSPETPNQAGPNGPVPPTDGPAHMSTTRDDEYKAGSSQELTQSQSQSQSQPLSQDLSVYITGPYRGRPARRLLSTSPDEEIKRQQ